MLNNFCNPSIAQRKQFLYAFCYHFICLKSLVVPIYTVRPPDYFYFCFFFLITICVRKPALFCRNKINLFFFLLETAKKSGHETWAATDSFDRPLRGVDLIRGDIDANFQKPNRDAGSTARFLRPQEVNIKTKVKWLQKINTHTQKYKFLTARAHCELLHFDVCDQKAQISVK